MHYSRYLAVLQGYKMKIKYLILRTQIQPAGMCSLWGVWLSRWKASKKMLMARSTMEYMFTTLDKASEIRIALKFFGGYSKLDKTCARYIYPL